MSDPYREGLDRLSRIRGVRGALIVDGAAGVPVIADVSPDVPVPALAALAASLYRRTERSARDAGLGQVRALQLVAEHGHILMAQGKDVMVVALAEPMAQLGLVRLEVRKLAEAVR